MTSREEARLNMQRAVEKHCDDNAAIIATVAAFVAAEAELKANIAAVLTEVQHEDLVITGITVSKSTAKTNLCEKAANVGAQVFAFASASGNDELKGQVNFPISELQRTKDDQLAPRCQNIHDLADDNLADLATYGIDAAVLTDLQTAITTYQSIVPSPRNATAQKKTTRVNIKNILKTNDVILKDRMDKLVVAFKTSNPDFYNTYKNNRIILDPGATTTELSGTVTNSADETVVTGALITVVATGNTATTNASGEYSCKPVPSGISDILVTAAGFVNKTIPAFTIKLGQNNVLNVEMVALL